jgi:hypothetical protein
MKKGFSLKYTPAGEVVGRDMAHKEEAPAHLHVGKLVNLPCRPHVRRLAYS